MNRSSTVGEHGVQPELPPQHSSCESWLLISGWLSGTNNPGNPSKLPSRLFTVCTGNCGREQRGTGGPGPSGAEAKLELIFTG